MSPVSFCFRIRFVLGPRVRITSEATSLLLTAPGSDEQVTLQPTEEGAAGKQNVLRPPMVQVESVKVVAETCK